MKEFIDKIFHFCCGNLLNDNQITILAQEAVGKDQSIYDPIANL